VSGPPEIWTSVDRLLGDLLLPDDPVIEAAIAANAAAGLPPHDVAPNQGRLLELITRIRGARRVLELGTLGGCSTIWLARGVPEDGRVVTIELDPGFADVARANLDHAGVGDRVEILVGAAVGRLERLVAAGERFDLVFIDADKKRNPEYLELAIRLSEPGTVIVADNVVREGAITDADDPDPRVRGIRSFLTDLGAHPRIDATAIQTVGAKGHDGLAIGLVR
jgi:predicted O-methyltransferase YrrM